MVVNSKKKKKTTSCYDVIKVWLIGIDYLTVDLKVFFLKQPFSASVWKHQLGLIVRAG